MTRVYPVYQTSSPGLPVLLLHELPGLTPGLLNLALGMEDRGYCVHCLRFPRKNGHGLRGSVRTK